MDGCRRPVHDAVFRATVFCTMLYACTYERTGEDALRQYKKNQHKTDSEKK